MAFACSSLCCMAIRVCRGHGTCLCCSPYSPSLCVCEGGVQSQSVLEDLFTAAVTASRWHIASVAAVLPLAAFNRRHSSVDGDAEHSYPTRRRLLPRICPAWINVMSCRGRQSMECPGRRRALSHADPASGRPC